MGLALDKLLLDLLELTKHQLKLRLLELGSAILLDLLGLTTRGLVLAHVEITLALSADWSICLCFLYKSIMLRRGR